MGSRGRPSAASLTVISTNGVEEAGRPKPPGELTGEEAAEWRAIVNRMPANWFGRETEPLLVQLVRHVVRSRRIGEMIAKVEKGRDGFDPEMYLKLLRAEESQSKVISSLSTKMRISQQSTYDKSKKKGANKSKLWDKDY